MRTVCLLAVVTMAFWAGVAVARDGQVWIELGRAGTTARAPGGAETNTGPGVEVLAGESEPGAIVARVVSESIDEIVLDIDVPGFLISSSETDQSTFSVLEMPDCGITTGLGKALLPMLRKAIEIPQGAAPQITVVDRKWARFTLTELGYPGRVIPVQPPIEKTPDAPGASRAREFVISEEFYTSSDRYPAYAARISETGGLRGHRFAMLEVAAVRYIPAEGAIEVLEHMRLRLTLPGADPAATERMLTRYATPHFELTASRMLLNYRASRSMPDPADRQLPSGDRSPSNNRPEAEPPFPSLQAVPESPIGYLIITGPEFHGAIQTLADWKSSKGYHTTVTSTDNIPGGADAAAIRDYIEDAYINWDIPPSFVLLVGDVDAIPGWTGLSSSNIVTDLYYSTMTEPDFVPDLGLGRLSVGDTLEIAGLVDKIIGYEQASFAGTAWLKKAAFMAGEDLSHLHEALHDYVVWHYMDPAGYYSQKLYGHTYAATTQDVRDAVNDGRVLLTYSGHGSRRAWTDGPPFEQADIESLTNVHYYPLVLSFACFTGSYALDECFGETWIRSIDKGAVAFLGSCVPSLVDEDEVLEKGVFRALYADRMTWLSGIVNQGKWRLYCRYGGQASTEYYYEMYNLLGDPALDFWTAPPATMLVEHDGWCPVGGSAYDVHVECASGPVDTALVCLDMPGEVYESAYTDFNGDLTLDLDPEPPGVGAMILTVTAHDFLPVVDTVYAIVPPAVTIDPDTVAVEIPTPVTITVRDSLAQPLPDVIVTIDGWGIQPALSDTTDALGQTVITVDAPYGEPLPVTGRRIGVEYNCFQEVLYVGDVLELGDPQVDAVVEAINMSGYLTSTYPGMITGRTLEAGLDMFAAGCGIDTMAASAADTVVIEITPDRLGNLAVVLAKGGYRLFTGQIPVIEAYGMLTGTTRDASTGDSLPEIPVIVYAAGSDTSATRPAFETTSGPDGTYASSDSIIAGPYDIYASRFPYFNYAESTMVEWGGNVFDVDMTPLPIGVVTGTLTEQGSGKPISGTIDVYRSDDMSLYTQTTSDSLLGGSYTTGPLPYYTYVFHCDAFGYLSRDVEVTVDDSLETADVDLLRGLAALLLIDDERESTSLDYGRGGHTRNPGGDHPAADGPAAGPSVAEGAEADGAAALTVNSPDLIAQHLTDLGYDVTTEMAPETNPEDWPCYDLLIWSAGDHSDPVADVAWRAALNAHVAAGGKLLIEGGAIGGDAVTAPGYPHFADTTLHVVAWVEDYCDNLVLANPDHPVAGIPNSLPDTLKMSYFNRSDEDALIPDGRSQVIYDWESCAGGGGVFVFDDNPDTTSSQVVLLAFDYYNMRDTLGRKRLLENAVVHLLTTEPTPVGGVSGNVNLYGRAVHEGAILTTLPMGLRDTTDISGDYSIEGLFDGTYEVTATSPGFVDSTATVVIAGSEVVTDLDFILYQALEYMDTTDVPIPNNDPVGVTAYLDVPVDLEIASVDCYIDIAHPYRGDLTVELASPEGTIVRLHDRTGGPANNIVTWYDTDSQPDGPGSMYDFTGESAHGQWQLWLSDQAYLNSGRLRTWGLSIAGLPATSGGRTDPLIPHRHFLARTEPNPFRMSTLIRFGLPKPEIVSVAIYSVTGRHVRTLASGPSPAGFHMLRWDGTDGAARPVAAGVYFCRLTAGNFTATRKVTLTR